ncbi:hypothetical protein EJ03DRAFT_326117 [Teratosphaeria nubilosa]|uniref:Uncharacterized protein n=1 Tax=Teratosphaeria nubilosa TaxID=161662 RepID=A0A6G1LD07_9PEZI|nr:hypothetical protein EJ03DRAFT_326117 [Teratosphaeria nubilosa]
MSPKGPYTLITVNSNPERAHRLVGRIIANLSENYTITHVANAESPAAAPALIETHNPDIVFTASMWTPEQSEHVFAAARKVNSKVKTLALPQGLQVEQGPAAVVEYIEERLPPLLESEGQ